MSAKPNLKPTLQALLDRDRRDLDEHPTPETLVAYHAGQIPAAEQETLRNHLTLCHDCADLLLDLVSFAEFTPPEQAPLLADVEVESAWQKFQPRLVAAERLPVVAQIAERRGNMDQGSVNWGQKLRVAYALAATLLVGVIGLSIWGGNLKKQVDRENEPDPNVVQIEARSDKERTRGPEEAGAPGQKRFVLNLTPDLDDPAKYSEYAADIFQAGAPITSIGGLVRSKEGTFSAWLSGKQVPTGAYEVEFYGIKEGHREKLDTLTFSIAAP